MNFITKYRLKKYLTKHYQLSLDSVHGPAHWKKVEQIGLTLADENGADKKVVSLFAWLHDSCRENEFTDPKHGPRAAELASSLRGKLFRLNDDQFEKLVYACKHHADGLVHEDVTIGTCWDADRLDLGRVGETPAEEYMSTDCGRNYLKTNIK